MAALKKYEKHESNVGLGLQFVVLQQQQRHQE
jgi:hypothetical protein